MDCNNKYLIRLDDASPTMHSSNWIKIQDILNKHGIRPMVGIIPKNEDPKQIFGKEMSDFWDWAKKWEDFGWTIALHGYNHVYHQTSEKGMNPIWNKSEFVGLPLSEQRTKIREGLKIMKQHGFNIKYFFAPSHTFDKTTLEALKLESQIRIISDTIATKPYKKSGFTFIPQVVGFPRKMFLNGVWTFCLHPNIMTEQDFKKLDDFIKENHSCFTSFDQLDLSNLNSKNFLSRIMTKMYFSYRKVNRLLK